MNKTKMEQIFCATQDELKDMLEKELVSMGKTIQKDDGYLYAKGTHPVLLVAHLDTVHKESPKTVLYSKDGNTIMSLEGIGGDDRCGVIMILDILNKYDCSVAFFEDEEIGCVGSKLFCKSGIDLSGNNYCVEFDRKGNNDYVFYKDYNADFEEHIKKFGFKKATGSCSDISYIAPAFKIESVNISCGYFNPHCWYEYVNIADMNDIIKRATKMVGTLTEKFEYVEDKPVKSCSYGSHYYKNWGSNYDDDDDYYSNLYSYGRGDSTSKISYTLPTSDPIYLKPSQIILLVNKLTVDLKDNIYLDKSSKLYWDKELTKPITGGEAIWRDLLYSVGYYSAKSKFGTTQSYKLEKNDDVQGDAVFIEKGQAILLVKGLYSHFKRLFISKDNRIYKNALLTKEIDGGDDIELLLPNMDKLKPDFKLFAKKYPEQVYNLKA